MESWATRPRVGVLHGLRVPFQFKVRCGQGQACTLRAYDTPASLPPQVRRRPLSLTHGAWQSRPLQNLQKTLKKKKKTQENK